MRGYHLADLFVRTQEQFETFFLSFQSDVPDQPKNVVRKWNDTKRHWRGCHREANVAQRQDQSNDKVLERAENPEQGLPGDSKRRLFKPTPPRFRRWGYQRKTGNSLDSKYNQYLQGKISFWALV